MPRKNRRKANIERRSRQKFRTTTVPLDEMAPSLIWCGSCRDYVRPPDHSCGEHQRRRLLRVVTFERFGDGRRE